MTKTAVLYARISVSSDESVSVARQLASGRKYAEARGWEVVGEFVDDGVSATRLGPEHRDGFKALLGSEERFDAVVVWKVDRFARKVLDFLNADKVLQARGAAIVCVEQTLDMTTGEGRAFAQMLAVFGEMESSATSSRIAAARDHMLRTGRSAGGVTTYGWLLVANPSGPGKVTVQDPDRIGWVRGMVERAKRGDTVYSIRRWLTAEIAPRPYRTTRASDDWQYTTVERTLTHPILAGLTLYNTGAGARGSKREVLRGPDGEPVVRPELAIMSVTEHRDMVHLLSHKPHGAAKARNLLRTTTPLLSKLAVCGACGCAGFMGRTVPHHEDRRPEVPQVLPTHVGVHA